MAQVRYKITKGIHSAGTLNVRGGKLGKYRILTGKRYEIGPYNGTLIGTDR